MAKNSIRTSMAKRISKPTARPWMLKRVQHDMSGRDGAIGDEPRSPHRHPELVSGSMAKRFGQTPRNGEVQLFGVALFDQVYFPLAMPPLELLFPRNRVLHIVKNLSMNEMINPISAGETVADAAAVLPNALRQVRCNTNIERTALLTGENVGARVARLHEYHDVAPWMLKQVQHDEPAK